jgi:proline dehydrogenase
MDANLDGASPAMRFGLGIPQQRSRNGRIHLGCSQIRMGTSESPFQSLIRRAASVYTAGPAVRDAQAICERLAHEGIANTICYWDIYSEQPNAISQAYIGALNAISSVTPDCYLSVKAPALKFDIELVKKVLAEAQRLNAIVHFDAMGPETVDQTFALIDEARRIYPRLGCTLPSRWQRSLADADRAIDMSLRVRVVKGEWAGLENDDTDPREGFLKLVECLAGRAVHVAVATHNPMMGRYSLRMLKQAGTPCELELLYGLPQQPMLRIARDFGVRARMYVPYGRSGLPYRLKQAIRNPRIIRWFMHDLLRGH